MGRLYRETYGRPSGNRKSPIPRYSSLERCRVSLSSSARILMKPHFSHAVCSNLSGGEVLAEFMSKISLLAPVEFAEVAKEEELKIIDTRSTAEFQKEHIPQSIHFYLGGEGGAKVGVTDGNFAMLLGYVLKKEEKLAVVAEEGKEAESMQRIARIGYKVSSCINGGLKAWKEYGLPLSTCEERKIVKKEEDVLQLIEGGYEFVDVRFAFEYNSNHLAHAKLHLPLPHIRDEANKLSKDRKYICYCKSGYRSSTAVSLLEGMGYHALGRRRPAGATGARVEMINQNRGGAKPPAPPLHAPLR